MNARKATGIGCLLAAMVVIVPESSGVDKPTTPVAALTPTGEALRTRYAEMLQTLQAEIGKSLPVLDEQKKTNLRNAREAVKKATAEMKSAQQPLSKVQTAQALVEHAKGKWIGGAEKGIAAAEAALKKASTDAERDAAKADLAKWQANKQDGLKALKERQAALDKAKEDEAKFIQAKKTAEATLARAHTEEAAAAKAVLDDVKSFISSDKLDAKLVKCAVLAQATPKGLAEFAQRGKEQEALVEQLLADTALMTEMLEAGGAKGGKYGQAMQIYHDIQKASTKSKQGILHRLALGTSLEHAVPVPQRNAVTKTDAPTVVDPVKRYLHYEKAYSDGELDPAFPTMTTWECRMIVDCETPDSVLAWGREMLRNYRPDHISNPQYGWRYSGAVRTDVAYRHSQEYKDTDSLEFFQNIIKNGGICGRRAFFGRYIVQSFGLPAWGVTQHAHAAVGRWTPAGWVVNLGANWEFSWYEGRTGPDFILETRARKHPKDYMRVLRAQWVGDVLGEQPCNSMKEGTGGWWNTIALFEKKAIVAEAKPVELPALGQELGEANESPATKSMAIEKTTITEADKKIVIDANGVITIPAAVCSGGNQLVKSYLGGLQMLCGAKAFACEVEVPRAGKYTLTARVVTVHDEGQLKLNINNAKDSTDVTIPFTCGMWEKTKPVEVTLVQGKNVLRFSKPASGFSLKDFTLTPVK